MAQPAGRSLSRKHTVVKAATSIPGPARLATLLLSDDELMAEYNAFLLRDAGVEEEAILAANEMRRVPLDLLDKRPVGQKKQEQAEGPVGRRAPPNPFHSPKLGKFNMQTEAGKTQKAEDPALQDNPLRGRLMATIGINMSLMFVFFQALIYNYLETGKYYVSHAENSMIGPSGQTLYDLGGLNTNAIRGGQTIRLFWAMWMHSGWIHIGFNVLCQLQYMYMLEPDWGFWRTVLIFWFSAMTGNFVTAIADPCKTSVGSSGGLFGLMGGIIAFCIEFWSTIPRPWCILIFSTVVAILSICTGLTSTTDTWCHLGGFLGGTLFGLGTITTLAEIRSGSKLKGQVKRNKYLVRIQAGCCPQCRCGWQEWACRIVCWSGIIVIWSVCAFYLFKHYIYNPLGSMTFHGMVPCCCCYDWIEYKDLAKNETTWTCGPCDFQYMTNSEDTFGEYCERQNAGETSRRLLLVEDDGHAAGDDHVGSNGLANETWDVVSAVTQPLDLSEKSVLQRLETIRNFDYNAKASNLRSPKFKHNIQWMA